MKKKKSLIKKLNLKKNVIADFHAAKIKGGNWPSDNCGATSGTDFCGNETAQGICGEWTKTCPGGQW